jgi:hypothetical protein
LLDPCDDELRRYSPMSTTKEPEVPEYVTATSYGEAPKERYPVTIEELEATGLLINTTKLAKLLGYSGRNTIEQQRSRDRKNGTKKAPPACRPLGRSPRYYLPKIADWLGLQVFPDTKAKMDAIAKAIEVSVKKKTVETSKRTEDER